MTYQEKYEQWLTFDRETREELLKVTDEKEKIPGKVNIVINRGRLSGSASATFYGEKEEDNYTLLKEILFEKAELWGEDVEKFDPAKISENDTFSFFSIARKEYDELAYSNAFAYFFEKYGVLLDAVGNVVREKYAVDIDPALHAEVLERYSALGLKPYGGFINPEIVPVRKMGRVVDYKIVYSDSYLGQMLQYGKKYSTL